MNRKLNLPDRGILNAEAGKLKYELTRYEPSPDLKDVIERYWIVKWDLRGQAPYTQVVVSHPNVNLVFERGMTRVYGISKTVSSQTLAGRGKVLGVKFRPGGFYPFLNRPVASLTGQSVAFGDVFGAGGRELEERILREEDAEAMIGLAERFFRGRAPVADEHVRLAGRIVDTVMAERDIIRVDDLVGRFGVSKRSLQRLFSQYVGVSPKWVISRYRLHEAAEQIGKGGMTDWSRLSQELGYYDQAHFIKDFKAIVGSTPETYVRAMAPL